MTQATICIPSNRSLETSLEPLWSAINYAEARGFKVVISDNSRDPIKKDYFAAAPEHVLYIADAPEVPTENLLSVLAPVETEFILMLGDDDHVFPTHGAAPLDFSSVADDVVGVKPRIELWDADRGVERVNIFGIDGNTAAARVIEYTQKMQGGNSTYYSFFRTTVFRSLMEFQVRHHPTNVGNSDFAFVYGLVAAGKIVHQPDTTVRYDNVRWRDPVSASIAMDALFDNAGLPRSARSYMLLFHFLDSYVLMFRDGFVLEMVERYKAAYALSHLFLHGFLSRTAETPADFSAASDLIPHLAEAVNSEDMDINKMFHIAGLIVDRLKPGLKQQYDQYLLAAIHGAPAGQQTQV